MFDFDVCLRGCVRSMENLVSSSLMLSIIPHDFSRVKERKKIKQRCPSYGRRPIFTKDEGEMFPSTFGQGRTSCKFVKNICVFFGGKIF